MFEVYDYYEECEHIDTADTYEEACAIAQQRVDDTDGECAVRVYDVKRGMLTDWEPI